jgi:hypothetical protein
LVRELWGEEVKTVGQRQNLDWYGAHSNSTQFTPEKRLAFAILVDALRQIFEHGAERGEALDWLMGRRGYREDSAFSAESVCDALNINLEAMRTRLRPEALGNNAPRMYRLPVIYRKAPGAAP